MTVAEVKVATGPSMLKAGRNARPASWIYIDVRGSRDAVSVASATCKTIAEQVLQMKPGISVSSALGQFGLLERANQKLELMVPMTLMDRLLRPCSARRSAPLWRGTG